MLKEVPEAKEQTASQSIDSAEYVSSRMLYTLGLIKHSRTWKETRKHQKKHVR